MPGFIGRKLCPDLVFVRGNHSKYVAVSAQVMAILSEYDPNLETLGLDEANIDATEYLRAHDQTTDEGRLALAGTIQRRIFEKTQLTASCGIAANRLLAKISCDMHKPNGSTLVPFNSDSIERFMDELSVRKIPGVGRVGEQLLNGLGIATCKQLKENAPELYAMFNESTFAFYMYSALGVGRNIHVESNAGVQKSISVRETFKAISEYV
jgi:DNA polymerase kappa